MKLLQRAFEKIPQTNSEDPLSDVTQPNSRVVRSGFVVRFGGWLCLVVVIAGGCPERTKPKPPVVKQPSSPPVEAEPATNPQLIAARSLALLENGAEADHDQRQLIESQAGFETLSKKFPNDPFGLQNLSVVLFYRLKQTDRVAEREAFESLSAQLTQALEQLETLTPDEPTADILAARQYLLADNAVDALQRYRSATKRPRAGSDAFYQLYLQINAATARGADGMQSNAEAKLALKAALDKSPGNLVLVVEWLKILAQNQDRQLVETIAQSRDLFLPLSARANSVIPKLLETAAQAAENEDWAVAMQQTNFLRNVCIAEIAFQHSLSRLEPHELEFVRLQFNQETAEQIAQDSAIPKRSRDVTELQFVERATLTDSVSAGTAIASEDFDLDGRDDLWCIAGNKLTIRSFTQSKGTEVVSEIELPFAVSGIAVADFDRDFQHRKDAFPALASPTTAPPNTDKPAEPEPSLTDKQMIDKYLDTDLDLVVYGAEGLRFYRNDSEPKNAGKRIWTEMNQTGIAELTDVRSVAVIDLDHDADLDVVISSAAGISLWSNRGDWTFADFTGFSQLPSPQTEVTDILALDADRNVLNDFLLASPGTDDSLVLKSNLHGRYFLQADSWSGVGFGGQRCLEVIDANSDACWDVVACGAQGTSLIQMKSMGGRAWIPDTRRRLSQVPMRDLLVADLDNDGFDDCLAWGAEGLQLFRPDAWGQLNPDAKSLNYAIDTMHTVALDADQDGDLDLVCLGGSGKLQLLENVGGDANQHLELVIRADEDGLQRPRERTNMHGVGSLVELKSGANYQSRIVRGTRTRFGLGKKSAADVLRIVWTNGIPNNVLDVGGRATVYDQQNLGGSCPYLYTWNGQRFEFCTDCLWAAPIGLQFAQGLSAPTRDWEYLRIDGSLLQPIDGAYVLQLTEELWEAAYFDAVELLAVDHPPDIEVYTNEKVGPAEIAEFKVHTVSPRQAPRRVVDPQGRDLSQIVAKRDGRFTKTWEQGLNQGLTEEHWIEIDFGAQANPQHLRLFLTGWMFPTSTSINVSMAENPLKPRSKPPSIWTPSAQGEWTEVIPYAGFPGGKTKTIAIDLSGLFLCEDHRVRLVSNMELCWDEVFFCDSPPLLNGAEQEVRLTSQPLQTADLHYRGFSRLTPQPHNAPKKFEYDQTVLESIWPPMRGAFTRYGDVTTLIRDADDMQVVLGAGDEMTLRFQATELPLQEGWVRDFVLYNVGWDKDADLNTIQGQSVEPLPFRDMKQYPYAPYQSFPDTAAHREYLRLYQTRQQSTGLFWHWVRDFGLAP